MQTKTMTGSTQRLVLTAFMIAIAFVLNRIVPATPVYHLSMDFLAIFIVGYKFGPLWAGLAYGIADTLGSILIPFGPYNPGITLSLVILGLIYGFVFYKRDLTGKKIIGYSVICAVLTFLVKLFITTAFLWPVYGADNTYWAYVLLRIPNCISIAIANIVLIPVVYKLLAEKIK